MKGVCAVLLVFVAMVSGLPNCANANGYTCVACDPGYYKFWRFCYNQCPTGFSNNPNGNCDSNDGVRMVFDLNFKDITDYSANSVETFSTPDGSAFRDSQNNPIPTKKGDSTSSPLLL